MNANPNPVLVTRHKQRQVTDLQTALVAPRTPAAINSVVSTGRSLVCHISPFRDDGTLKHGFSLGRTHGMFIKKKQMRWHGNADVLRNHLRRRRALSLNGSYPSGALYCGHGIPFDHRNRHRNRCSCRCRDSCASHWWLQPGNHWYRRYIRDRVSFDIRRHWHRDFCGCGFREGVNHRCGHDWQIPKLVRAQVEIGDGERVLRAHRLNFSLLRIHLVFEPGAVACESLRSCP